jgi:YcxB-like protein
MRIDFELEKKDLLAFQIYVMLHSKSLRLLYLALFLFQVFLAFSPFFSDIISGNKYNPIEIYQILIAVLSAVLGFVLLIGFNLILFSVFQGFYIFCLMLKFKKGDGTIGQHVIELRENCLLEVSDVNSTEHNWKSVQKIVEWRNYFLLYVSPTNAHLIPKRFFVSDEEAKRFLNEAKRLKDNSELTYNPSYFARCELES